MGLTGRPAGLARHTDEHGAPLYGLIPNLLPTVGFKHDPDGFNYGSAQGHLFLSWVDDNGVTQTRYYDGAGNRNDDTGQTLIDVDGGHVHGGHLHSGPDDTAANERCYLRAA